LRLKFVSFINGYIIMLFYTVLQSCHVEFKKEKTKRLKDSTRRKHILI